MDQNNDAVWLTTRVDKDFKKRVRIGAAIWNCDVSQYIREAILERLEREDIRIIEAGQNGKR